MEKINIFDKLAEVPDIETGASHYSPDCKHPAQPDGEPVACDTHTCQPGSGYSSLKNDFKEESKSQLNPYASTIDNRGCVRCSSQL